jgi:hypothetical protein
MSQQTTEVAIEQYYMENFKRKEVLFNENQQRYWQLSMENGHDVPGMPREKRRHDALYAERKSEITKCQKIFGAMKEQELSFFIADTLFAPVYSNFCLGAIMSVLGVVEKPRTLCFKLSDLRYDIGFAVMSIK